MCQCFCVIMYINRSMGVWVLIQRIQGIAMVQRTNVACHSLSRPFPTFAVVWIHIPQVFQVPKQGEPLYFTCSHVVFSFYAVVSGRCSRMAQFSLVLLVGTFFLFYFSCFIYNLSLLHIQMCIRDRYNFAQKKKS